MRLTRKLKLSLGGAAAVLFFVALGAVWLAETKRAIDSARTQASNAARDIVATVSRLSDRNILDVARLFALRVGSANAATDEQLVALRDTFGITEAHVVDSRGIIIASTVPEDKMYDMASGPQSAEFLCLLHGTEEFAQDLQAKAHDGSSMRFAGVAFPTGGFMQVALDENAFRLGVLERSAGITENIHVGADGCVLLADGSGCVISAPPRLRHYVGFPLRSFCGQHLPGEENSFRRLFLFDADGRKSYGWLEKGGDFTILVVLPTDEVYAARDKLFPVLFQAELPIFLAFALAFHFLLRRLVTDDIKRLAGDLRRIAAGDLSCSVGSFSTDEFASISDSANAAVAALRRQSRKEKELLERERDAVLASEKARSYFFSTVSHDIRTPLNAIIGFSQLLETGAVDGAERSRCLSGITSSGKVLLQLVNDVLDLSKLEADKMVFEPVWTSPAEIAAETISAFSAAAKERGLALSVECPPDIPQILADPHRLRQVLFNFVGNAMKFTRKGSVRVAVRRVGGDGLEFAVIDTGCGISRENVERLGSPYVQLDNSSGTGTGLGLAICKQLLARMGGEMRIESEEGKGSVFAAVLHGVKFGSPADRSVKQVAPGADAGEQEVDDSTWRAYKVLLVDDIALNLHVLSSLCRRLGVTRVDTAQSGADALAKLREWAASGDGADLVLTDLWMPQMGGEELAAAIRADPALANTKVCAVTADVELRKSGKAKMFDSVLLKPILLDALRGFFRALAVGTPPRN